MTWMEILAACIVLLLGVIGVALTLLTLPGAWLTIAVAVGCNVWQPGLISWWTIGAAVALAAIGEALEFFASAAGARKFGGSRPSAVAAVVGSIVGAIVGTPFLPPIGTVGGAVLGAGVGALIAERGLSNKGWRESAQVGTGAAAGRLAATIIKTCIAGAVAVTLVVAAFVK